MTEQRFRIQTGMVLHALERDLGDFIRARANSLDDLEGGTIKAIIKKHNKISFQPDDINTIIEISYFDDLWPLALQLTNDDSERSYLEKLRLLSESLEVFNIRNSVAHPNRPFPESYWWRIGVIATHENCELLQFSTIQQTFRQAIEGTLEDLPEDWLDKLTWRLPNNLPTNPDFEETGLIGRKKEKDSLQRLIRDRRQNLIAVIAPGGIGKTALVLSVLNELVFRPETAHFCSAICYVSLKTEQLQYDGLETIRTFKGRESIKDYIATNLQKFQSSTSESTHDDKDSKVDHSPLLLCIDNAETILRDHSDFFLNDIYDELPENVRVIVTSRIQLDGARSLTLNAIEMDQAHLLARKYSEVRNLNNISDNRLSSIAERARRNPLAIRLIVDRIGIQGAEILDAFANTEKDIAEFSFSNLLDILDDNTVLVLEGVHMIKGAMADDIAVVLNKSKEEVMESLNKLVRTSIVTRREITDVEDCYEVNSTIEDFILANNRNISAREKVNERMRTDGRVDQEVAETQQYRGISEYKWYYIPPEVPAPLKKLAKDVKVLWRGELDEVKSFYDELRQHEEVLEVSSVYSALVAKCLERFGAYREAEVYIKKAKEQSGGEPRYLAMLARFFHDRERFEEAQQEYRRLWDMGFADSEKNDAAFATMVVMGYYLGDYIPVYPK